MLLSHLVMGDGLLKSLDESHHLSGIHRLVHEPSRLSFCQHLLRSLLDFFQYAVRVVSEGEQGGQLASAPGQLCSSSRLLGVSINRSCGNVQFEPVELGSKTFNLVLNVFEFLRCSCQLCAAAIQSIDTS